ncbi:hypothetical protein [Spirosoma sp.]|uniref:hypothetical protein n=1 Tax=Spirosoma sp. TaxID=1899569 RepID=UPI002638F5F1|nr:hypothetical protein [Spirosoma sp.]MCX6217862.1 hypothetical protein [Spirosoma sp.]
MASLCTYSIAQLLHLITGQFIEDNTFHLGYFTGQDRLLPYPYRVHSYALGVPVSGSLSGSLNLDTFEVQPGQIMIISPGQIHRILSCSADFAMRSLFFTDAFLTNCLRNPAQVMTLGFFQPPAPIVMTLTREEWQRINALIDVIEHHYWPVDQAASQPGGFVLQALLANLNHIYNKGEFGRSDLTLTNRPAELANQFRRLVTQHYLTMRHVSVIERNPVKAPQGNTAIGQSGS